VTRIVALTLNMGAQRVNGDVCIDSFAEVVIWQ
jgi:hypothetical protein